jgi:hypothetical protein
MFLLCVGCSLEAVCEAMAALGDKNPDVLQPAVPTVLACLTKWSQGGLGSCDVQVTLCVCIQFSLPL